MVMALRAAQGETEHRFAQGLHAVGVVIHQVLLGDSPSLVGVHVVSLEPGGDELGFTSLREKVSGNLLDDKTIVRQVVVE